MFRVSDNEAACTQEVAMGRGNRWPQSLLANKCPRLNTLDHLQVIRCTSMGSNFHFSVEISLYSHQSDVTAYRAHWID